jgi:hypothetical protein
LRHGVFSYEDLSGWGETSNRKTIKLLFKRVKCYPIKTNQQSGRFLFALAENDGPKRLWMADTEEDMQSWIDATKTAMIGSAGDFSDIDLQEAATADIEVDVLNAASEGGGSLSTTTYFRHASQLDVDVPKLKKKMFNSAHETSSYFASDVQRFSSVQFAFANAPNADAYRDLFTLYASEPSFTVPVSTILVFVRE